MAIIVVVVVAGAGAIGYMILSSSGDDDNDVKGQTTPLLAFQEMVNGFNEKDPQKVIGNSFYAFADINLTSSFETYFDDAFVNNTVTVVSDNLTQIENADIPNVMIPYLENQCSGLNMSYDLNITGYAVLHVVWAFESSNTSISVPATPYYVIMVQIEGRWFFGQFIPEGDWLEDNEWEDETGGASTPEEAFQNVVVAVNTQDWGIYLKNTTYIFYDTSSQDYMHDLWETEVVNGSPVVTYQNLTLLSEEEVPTLVQETLIGTLQNTEMFIGQAITEHVILECHMSVSPGTLFVPVSDNASHILVIKTEGLWYVHSFIDDATWNLEIVPEVMQVDDYLMYEINDGANGHLLMKVVAVNDTDYEFSITYMHDGTSEELEHVFINRSSGIFWWEPGANVDIVPENLQGTVNFSVDFFQYGETRLCREYFNLTDDGMYANTVYVGVNGIIYRYGEGIGMTPYMNYLLMETNIPWV